MKRICENCKFYIPAVDDLEKLKERGECHSNKFIMETLFWSGRTHIKINYFNEKDNDHIFYVSKDFGCIGFEKKEDLK